VLILKNANLRHPTFLELWAARQHRATCFLKTSECVFKLIFSQMAEEIMFNGQKVLPQKALGCGFKFSHPTIQQSLSKIFRS
jgi:NAD dependent epimerase/dehydratase family enzyme